MFGRSERKPWVALNSEVNFFNINLFFLFFLFFFFFFFFVLWFYFVLPINIKKLLTSKYFPLLLRFFFEFDFGFFCLLFLISAKRPNLFCFCLLDLA